MFGIFSHLPWWSVVWIIGSGCTLYLTLTVELSINGGRVGGWRPLAYAWDLISWWYLPHASKRRYLYMQEHIVARKYGGAYCGTGLGATKSWIYSDVAMNDQYLECANDMLPSRWAILIHLLIAMFWPIVITLLAISNLVRSRLYID